MCGKSAPSLVWIPRYFKEKSLKNMNSISSVVARKKVYAFQRKILKLIIYICRQNLFHFQKWNLKIYYYQKISLVFWMHYILFFPETQRDFEMSASVMETFLVLFLFYFASKNIYIVLYCDPHYNYMKYLNIKRFKLFRPNWNFYSLNLKKNYFYRKFQIMTKIL